MAKSRKTIEVNKLKQWVNDMLLNSVDNRIEARQAIASFLSSILHETNNYKGFNYLTKEMMEKSEYGQSIGIQTDSNGMVLEDIEKRFQDTDETRKFYY